VGIPTDFLYEKRLNECPQSRCYIENWQRLRVDEMFLQSARDGPHRKLSVFLLTRNKSANKRAKRTTVIVLSETLWLMVLVINKYIWVIFRAGGQDGWILTACFISCVYGPLRAKSSVLISSLLDRISFANKGFIIWHKEPNFPAENCTEFKFIAVSNKKKFSRKTAGSPARAR